MNEWELLVSSEEIKKGDIIIVENEYGHTENMKLIKWTDKSITLRNQSKDLIKFRADTLESKNDEGFVIVGKKELSVD